ncbi:MULTISPECIES: MBL fold metallo-hydrolase [Haloferax]|uniref:MBL fold metallo-hydrolase n=2 Tax=Haloferax TaxID=2251 RepID=A0A6G1Z3P5_9EURY|nr:MULTISPECIES: MBL fold metallo-hydrolase [Haloferax]KAB1188473.1 MBL fold metallo-hydrolase [Haloferax sp. CBA1149]MRW81166.1 MBL fold metallo-hydrolase [Haloferax marinisediminis]
MTPDELAVRLRHGDPTTILDVRNRDEFDEWHVDGRSVTATQMPAIRFTQAEVLGTVADVADQFRDAPSPVVVVCGEGRASDHVASLLSSVGVDAENLESGMEGWARVYRSSELSHADATVLQYDRPSSGCLAYLVVAGDEAVVVDPLRAFADRYVEDAHDLGADIVAAIDTHVHADHVSGVRAVADRTGAEIVLPAGAAVRGLSFDTRLLADGESVTLGAVELVAVHSPGHTSEMTAYRLGDVLFVGDGLFVESVARPDLEDGDDGAPTAARQLYQTLTDRYGEFDDTVRIAPAHYSPVAVPDETGVYVASLGELRQRLDALSMDADDFVEYVLADMPPRPANYERIIETNLGIVDLDDDDAFDVEVGPNNCAATTSV